MQTCAVFAKDWLDDWIWMVVDAGISSLGNTWVVPLAFVVLCEVVVIVVWLELAVAVAGVTTVVFWTLTTPT